MRDSVKQAFATFTDKFEGRVSFMYCDVLGLVTCGRGNLIDPVGAALGLPWVRNSDGALATQAEIVAAWQAVKARQDLKLHGGYAYKSVAGNDVSLTSQGIDDLTLTKLAQIEATLKARPEFASFDSWPADAQLGLLSMAWAMGAAFRFPQFQAAAALDDFNTCAVQGQMNAAGNPGLVPRNAANKVLFHNAACVRDDPNSFDPEVLYYPRDCTIVTP